MSRIDIGFLEKSDSKLLRSHHFPSKIGGKPAWLSLKNLPSSSDLKCSVCQQPMVFLSQIYAPFEEDSNNFHRIIFVFICRDSECSKINDSSNIKVWRSQLSKNNEFYSSEPPNENSEFDIEKFIKLCTLCGCPSEKHCSQCKKASYCTKQHQVLDWKAGHKKNCVASTEPYENPILFEEYELVIEEEQEITKEEKNETQRMEEYENLLNQGKTGTLSDISEQELDAHTEVTEDKIFLQFKKKISENPDQVLRYSRGGEPLWIAQNPKPEIVPNCEACGAERQFEFQVLPQLLFELKEEKLDWGILVVYTCKNSCVEGNSYKKEYVFKQDISN